MNAKEHIDDKLIRYLLGECDAEESREVERWVAESAKNRRYFEDFRRFHLQVQEAVQWEAVRGTYPDFRRRLLQLRGRRKRLRVFVGMAAGLALLVGIGLAVFLKDNGKVPAEAELLAAESIQPGGVRATLHLSNGEQVDLGEEARQLEEQDGTLLAADGNGILNYRSGEEAATDAVYNRLEVPRGGEFRLKLADGTSVWLNAESELRYPAAFVGGERRVVLKGEAYFQVETDSTKPFIVEAEGMETWVYGTEFNVSTQQEGRVQAVLVSGRVGVRYGGEETLLAPSQKAEVTLADGSINVQEVDVLPYVAWKDGIFMFHDESLEAIMEKLGRWYNIDAFFANEEVKGIRLSGMLERHKDVRELFRHFEKISVARFSVQGNTVVVQ